MNNKYILAIIAAVVFGGVGFFGGTQYQKSKITNTRFNRNSMTNQNNNQQNNNFRRGNGAVVGEVTAKDSQSITVKSQDGSSKIIIISDKTTVSKSTTGSISDLKVGDNITAFGTSTTDGSITATNILTGNKTMPQAGQGQGGPNNIGQDNQQPPANN